MVSLWPFSKGDDTASFEKTLSSLSSKIKKANLKQDGLRARSRRYKVLWTLYTSLAYLLAALILVLVTGWRNWGALEYTVTSGGPVLIYLVRAALSAYYDYRLSYNQSHLDDLNKQRDSAIDKFKAATKFDTTQQLLEKYGAGPKQPSTPKDSPAASGKRKSAGAQGKPLPQRTGIAPPPTANIRRPTDTISNHGTPQQSQPLAGLPGSGNSTPIRAETAYSAFHSPASPPSPDTSASFAPNAFIPSDAPPQYAQPQWYDRVMDLLLGEDETRASNRFALICQNCRLVNGQAPPGVKKLEDVGRWRCAECKGWNGVESEVSKIMKEVKAAPPLALEPEATEPEVEDEKADEDLSIPADEHAHPKSEPEVGGSDEVEVVEHEDVDMNAPTRTTRSRAKEGAIKK